MENKYCESKVIATSSTPTGVPSLGWSKEGGYEEGPPKNPELPSGELPLLDDCLRNPSIPAQVVVRGCAQLQ